MKRIPASVQPHAPMYARIAAPQNSHPITIIQITSDRKAMAATGVDKGLPA